MSTTSRRLDRPVASTATVDFDRAGRHLTVYVSGELDAASAPCIGTAVRSRIQPDDERVWMDLSTTTFCDSSGLMMFFTLHRLVEETGGRFIIYNPTPQVRRIIEICDQSNVLPIRS